MALTFPCLYKFKEGKEKGKMQMQAAEQRFNFIVNNSRLEGMYCTEEEKNRLRRLIAGEITIEEALQEVFSKLEDEK